MVRLSELVGRLGGVCGSLGPDPELRDVELDSRRTGAGHLFAALPGQRFDGAEFAAQAVLRGAVAVLSTRRLDAAAHATGDAGREVPNWVHPQARRVAGEAAAQVHGRPSGDLAVLAITGTNGKTTVAWIAGQLLERAGRRPAVLGTVSYRVAGEPPVPARTTTPEATELQRLFARHRAAGGDAVCLEASSHALEQDRLAGTEVDVAVFTNLSRDHLDYHRDMEHYASAKARLFEGLDAGGAAVVNADDPASARMVAVARSHGARVTTFGIRSRADLCASDLRVEPRGIHLFLHGMGISKAGLFLPLAGRHNVENALAAAAAVLEMGASPSAVLEGLATVSSAPGRLEHVPTPERDFTVLVDYAHTDAALERVLEVVRESLEAAGDGGRLIVVFGCGGCRDAGKRAPMGAIAARLADVVVVTSDNPRDEDPGEIIAQILRGLEGGRAEVHVEADRRAAIALATSLARAGDLLLIAGKGHENVQKLEGGRELPFDDRQVAAEVCA